MNSAFLDSITEKKDILKFDEGNINKFFLENNLKQLEEIQKFLLSNKPIMLVNGFLGTGKSTLAGYVCNKFLKEDVIVLKYNCFETTILDDLLLAFFDEFKSLTVQGIIRPPKVKTENFAQKIETYCSAIEKPILIIIDSFESVLKPNKQEILNFIFHLAVSYNVKTMFLSRVFDYKDFEGSIPYSRTTVLALDKSLFEKFLRAEGMKLIGPVSDEFYKYSRGYFFYTILSMKVINADKLSLIDFIKNYTNSFLSYNDFILREVLMFVDPIGGHLLRFLTTMRHPVSISLLKTLNLYDEQRIIYYAENLILSKEKDMIYLKDFYKDIASNAIPESVQIKLHKACVDLYNTQLPLKPFERDLLISRQTMRTEIEYHSMFIPKKPLIKPTGNSPFSIPRQAAVNVEPAAETPSEVSETKEEKIKHISFIFDTEEDEKKIMSGIATSINKFIDYSNKTLSEDETNLSLKEMLNSAKTEENQYNYKKAIAFYQRALLMKDDDDFCTFLPLIYSKLSGAYSALSDWFNALRYYDLALEFYSSAGDVQKIAEIKLQIANVYYITFKHDRAKSVLSEILAMKGIEPETVIKACIAMADINSTDLRAVYSYCKKALDIVSSDTDKKVLAGLYYKYAVVCDDLDETETAVKFYKECIEIDKDNSYLSSAYSNLASIVEDSGYEELAGKYYQKSYELDLKDNNYNGMYFSALKLAWLNRKKNPDIALDFYKKAVLYSANLKEFFCQLTALVELGDFYVVRKNYKEAMEKYLEAQRIAKLNFSYENAEKIKKRITELKIRLGSQSEQ